MNLRLRAGGAWLAIATLIGLRGSALPARADDHAPGAVYTLSNEAAGNQLVVLQRDQRGNLALAGTVATGGMGLGTGLGSQGALAFGVNSRVLYAVNAGSNSISVLRIRGRSPELLQITDSAGLQPISLTNRRETLYVLNSGSAAGDVDQITGFAIHPGLGRLSLLHGSTQGLSAANVGPAQVQFSNDGKLLVVTEKGTNLIDTFLVNRQGRAGGVMAQPSAGMTPYGFAFNQGGYLIVSEAAGGAASASTVSSYAVNTRTGAIHAISPAVPTLQTAACWIAVTRDGRYAYSSNTGSGNVTGFRVESRGMLTRLSPNGVSGVTGGAAIDSAIVDDRFLYVLSQSQNGGTVTGFEIQPHGSLQLIGSVGGLPASTVGLVAE